MIGITPDNDLGLGDVTVEYRFDVKLIKSLLNLENNRIVPDKEAIMKKELIGEFLSDFIYLPDVLLHHDRLVLPRPKKFYIKKIGEELLSSCIIEKLEKSGILHFPQSEIYDIEMAKETHKQLIDLASSDPRVRLIALLSAPDAKLNSTWLKKHNFVEKNKDFNRYWAGGSDDIVEWLNTVDLEKMYAVIPKDAARDPILSRRKVEGSPGYSVFLTSNISVIDGGYYSQDFKFFDDIARKELKQGSKLLAKHLQNKLSKPSESSLWRILNRLSETRASIEKDLIERKYITATQTYRIPFSLGLLISEADKKLNPVDLIDLILEKRRERGNRAFRRWLKEYDDEIKKDSPDRYKLKRMGDEIDQVALKLREEYPGKILTEKTIHSASNFGKEIFEIGIRSKMLDVTLAKKLFDTSINILESIYPKLCFPYKTYMQTLGTADTKVLEKLELDQVFGDQGREFASILRYYSAIDKKSDMIFKMKKR